MWTGPEKHVKAISAFLNAGFDQVHVNQIGPDQEGSSIFTSPNSAPGWTCQQMARSAGTD